MSSDRGIDLPGPVSPSAYDAEVAPALRAYHPQSTATSSAAQTSLIRASESRPIRSTRTATATLSTESRLIADGRGIGSPVGSRITSLGRPRMVVVHGATRARRKRGIAALRDRTTTGLLPTSGSSHHQTSPLAGKGLTTFPQPHGMQPGLPIRRARPTGARHRPNRPRQPAQNDGARARQPERRR
jgi:hypothetical protein